MLLLEAADFSSKTTKCQARSVGHTNGSPRCHVRTTVAALYERRGECRQLERLPYNEPSRRREGAPAPSNRLDAASFHAIMRDRVEKIILFSCRYRRQCLA